MQQVKQQLENLQKEFQTFKMVRKHEMHILKISVEVENKCLPVVKEWLSKKNQNFFLQLEKLGAEFINLQTENVPLHERINALQHL